MYDKKGAHIMYYAGIGSRETPEHTLNLMSQMASYLANKGYTLRSGGADGADIAFENGCDKVNGLKEIYLPWGKFNGSNSNLIVKDKKAFELAEMYHPYWHNLSQGAKKLQARNCHQVLGNDLKTPSKFIICYTKDGKRKGGTGQALRIAETKNIDIFDCGLYNDSDTLKNEYRKFLKLLEIIK